MKEKGPIWKRMAELKELAGGRDLLARGYEVDSGGNRIDKPMGYPRFRRMGWQTRNKPFFLESGRMLLPLYSDGFDFSLIAYTDDGENPGAIANPYLAWDPFNLHYCKTRKGYFLPICGTTDRLLSVYNTAPPLMGGFIGP